MSVSETEGEIINNYPSVFFFKMTAPLTSGATAAAEIGKAKALYPPAETVVVLLQNQNATFVLKVAFYIFEYKTKNRLRIN